MIFMKITDKITMLLSDRNDVLSELSNYSFEVGIFDLEYGIGESSKNFGSRNTPVIQSNGKRTNLKTPGYKFEIWDANVPEEDLFDKIKSITQNQIYFGANYYKEIIGLPQKPPRRNEYQDFLSANPTGWIIWDKINGSNDFSDCELIYTSYDFPSHVVYFMWSGMMQGIYCGSDFDKANVQQGDKLLNVKRIHPTQKPVPIYKYLLSNIINTGDEILELGFGSGSLAIACHDYDFSLLTCENNINYYKLGTKRVIDYTQLGQFKY